MSLIKGIFGFVEDTLKGVIDFLIPKKAYSWQILIYLSIFSLIMSFFATGAVRHLIEYCGWLFLIAGTAWSTTDKPVTIPGTNMPIGALVTGALVSLFLFSRFINGTEEIAIKPISVVVWPTFAAIITAIPEFFEGSGTDVKRQLPKLLIRQQIIILLAVCMMISCWIQFYFITESWFNKYPTLRTENFGASRLIIGRRLIPELNEEDLDPNKVNFTLPLNGIQLLNRLSPRIEKRLEGRMWGEVERWLLDSVNQTEQNRPIVKLAQDVKEKVLKDSPAEKPLWLIEPRVSNTKTGYKLDLLAIWRGPSFMADRYYLQKSCEITPFAKEVEDESDENATVNVAEIDCQRAPSLIPKKPPAKN